MHQHSRINKSAFFVLMLIFASQLLVAAVSGPELVVRTARGKPTKLVIEEFKAEVFFLADIAETIITITFRNPESRMLEGEFAIPLPENATVSSYALDVNGKMRKGVIVEKEKARFAYESIKRQMIDPGYVEREAGNVYRTKIFPIPRKGTKTVQIGFRELLPQKNNHLDYHLPLPASTSISKVHFSIQHLENTPITIHNSAGLVFDRNTPSSYKLQAQDILLGEKFHLQIPASHEPTLLTNGSVFYFRTPLTPQQQTSTRRMPKSIQLAWDCSESSNSRDLQKEFQFLESYFQQLKNVTVDLTLLHLINEKGGSFQIRNGNWSALKNKLQTLLYDGATNLSSLTLKNDLTLLFSDGISHFHTDQHDWKNQVILFHHNESPSSPWHKKAASSINLSASSISNALSQTNTRPFTLLSLADKSPSQFLINHSHHHEMPYRAFGTMDHHAVKSEFRYLDQKGEEISQSLKVRHITDPQQSQMLQAIWAQRKLQQLEIYPIENRSLIITHCKAHGLVSDETSLIVLERFSDYVRYEIQPPEEQLHRRYQEALKRKNPSSQLARQWQYRERWHEKIFPWHDFALFFDLNRINKWENAISTTFQNSEVDQKALTAVQDWKKKALDVIRTRTSLTTNQDFLKWQHQITQLQESHRSLRSLSSNNPQSKTAITVSVRGLVNHEGKVTGADNLTLLQAVKKAGGLHFMGTPSAIALYRNGSKVLYNTLSQNFRDIPLQAGDMIVAETPPFDDGGWGDPFASESDSTPINPQQQPAIVEEKRNLGPITLGTPFSSDDTDPSQANSSGEIIKIARNPSLGTHFKTFEKALQQGASPMTTYAKLRQAKRHSDEFYIQASQILRAHGHQNFANRVLSNLIEEDQSNIASYRHWAFQLAKENQFQAAHSALQAIIRHYPKEALLLLDQAWIYQILKSPEKALALWANVAREDSSELGEIAAAHLNGFKGGSQHLSSIDMPKTLALDLRVIISSASAKNLFIQIKEPSGTKIGHPFRRTTSACGGRITRESGLVEYGVRNAIPGIYQLTYKSDDDQLVRVQIFKNWGRSHMTVEEKIIVLRGGKDRQKAFDYEIEFPN